MTLDSCQISLPYICFKNEWMGFDISVDNDEISVRVAISQICNRLIALHSGLNNIFRIYE